MGVRAGNVIVSHPTGNANVSAVVSALNDDALLAAFYTCIVWRPESALAKVMPRAIRSLLERRARVQIDPWLVRTRPSRELMRNLLIRAGKKQLIAAESSPFSIDGVYRDLDRFVARSLRKGAQIDAVYAYEDGALHQFRQAKKLGIRCIYDLPIGYWRVNRSIAQEEADLQPEWKGTLNALADSDAKCALKDEEISLADTIVVASQFTRSTLDSFPQKKKSVSVIPYGVPTPTPIARELTNEKDPLRVLYVGSLTQRKGISYLLSAIAMMRGAATLTMVGRKVGSSKALDKACEQHRWHPSLPHTEILALMREHDVFVFPSLFEGFGLVIGEALSQGVPVITTSHTGGPDIMRDGKDGFIVPIRDAEGIAMRLLELYQDREKLKAMSDAARTHAAELDWQVYKTRTAATVREAIGLA
jgi:glycosyltransferase involved in cell wall biosynthesis